MNAALVLGATAWLAAAMTGFTVLWGYASEPGPSAGASVRWPVECTISLDPNRPTLLVLAHPLCPCTRATLDELDRLVAQVSGELSAHVLFYRPLEAGADWTRGRLWSRAAAIPGVAVHEDPAGVEAERFGAVVSGQVFLYDRRGALLFQGGITPGRGHSGDSTGRSAVVNHVLGRSGARAGAPVYGCSLRGVAEPAGRVR